MNSHRNISLKKNLKLQSKHKKNIKSVSNLPINSVLTLKSQ